MLYFTERVYWGKCQPEEDQILGNVVWTPSSSTRWRRQQVHRPRDDRPFYTLHFREERYRPICKNLHWPDTGDRRRWSGGRSTIGAQSIRKKYLLLLVGYRQWACKFMDTWDVVASGGHYRSWFKAPTYTQNGSGLLLIGPQTWIEYLLVSLPFSGPLYFIIG